MTDYSFEHLDSLFELSTSSPSGIAFKHDRYGGKNNKQVLRKAGSPAGSKEYSSRSGKPLAWRVTNGKTRYQAHRVIWVLVNGELSHDMIVDHLDGNPFNNTLNNLASKTTRQNNQNVAKSTRNTSGVVGVSPERDKYGRTFIWAATWNDAEGNVKRMRFKISEYGDLEAKQMAIEFRTNIMKELKDQGLSYTDRHGL